MPYDLANQEYPKQKYTNIGPIHPLIMASEFLLRPQQDSSLDDWDRLTMLAEQYHWVLSTDWQPSVLRAKTALLITNTQEQIVWANRGFTHMTGYSLAQVKGRKPSILQGKDTEPATRQQIRQHLQQRLAYSGTVLNYRYSGEPYWCRVRIHPLYNELGELLHFIAIENEVKKQL